MTRIENVPVFGASPDDYLFVFLLNIRQLIRSLLTSPTCRRLMRSQNSAEKMRTLAGPGIIKDCVIAERAGFAIRAGPQSSRCTIARIFPNRSDVPNNFVVVASGQTINSDFLGRNISTKRMPLLVFNREPLLVREESSNSSCNERYEEQPEYGVAKRALVC